jgi:hypothetical protein
VALNQLSVGDFVVAARGRRYFSNDAILASLAQTEPDFQLSLGQVPSARIFILNDKTLEIVRNNAPQSLTPTERR